MDFSIVGIAKASKVYHNQERIAELNQKHPFKSIQGQADRVSISASAQRLLLESQDSKSSSPSRKTS
ncbi:MAG: hypothetical protein IID17_00775 [Nitrospinae bacterium]|nr:hypothetical protein [Nitrospinota bacterium]